MYCYIVSQVCRTLRTGKRQCGIHNFWRRKWGHVFHIKCVKLFLVANLKSNNLHLRISQCTFPNYNTKHDPVILNRHVNIFLKGKKTNPWFKILEICVCQSCSMHYTVTWPQTQCVIFRHGSFCREYIHLPTVNSY